MKHIYEKVLALISSNISGAIATVIDTSGSSPSRIGQKMVVTDKGYEFGTVGGGALEKKVIDDSVNAILSNKVITLKYDLSDANTDLNMWCGGKTKILIEPFNAEFKVNIIGAGHVGKALAYTLSNLGFSVTITDDRQDLLDKIDDSSAKKVLVLSYTEYFKKRNFDERDAFIIVTRGHSFDYECAGESLKTKASFIGMIGSRKKTAKLFQKLREQGFENSNLTRLTAPIGISIGADTPEEISISISAQLIAWKKSFPFDEIADISIKWREMLLKGKIPEKLFPQKSNCPV
jgi:xanthine dehydrogenase accessory factor